MRLICYFIAILILSSCENVNTSKINLSNDDISWQTNDEFPSIDFCDQFKSNYERFSCFKNKLSELIINKIDVESISVNQSLNDTIIVDILIDKSGKISLLNKKINDVIKKQIPEIESILDSAIIKLPTVLPAVKTNIGVEVDSTFELPLIIKSS